MPDTYPVDRGAGISEVRPLIRSPGRLLAAGVLACAILSGCSSSGVRVGGSVSVGVGYYDPWYRGPGYYNPPVVVVPPKPPAHKPRPPARPTPPIGRPPPPRPKPLPASRPRRR